MCAVFTHVSVSPKARSNMSSSSSVSGSGILSNHSLSTIRWHVEQDSVPSHAARREREGKVMVIVGVTLCNHTFQIYVMFLGDLHQWVTNLTLHCVCVTITISIRDWYTEREEIVTNWVNYIDYTNVLGFGLASAENKATGCHLPRWLVNFVWPPGCKQPVCLVVAKDLGLKSVSTTLWWREKNRPKRLKVAIAILLTVQLGITTPP